MSLLSIRNLSVDFETTSGAFRAVDGVDLEVDGTDILAIVGESGSGKSVSMLALMGLLPWTAKVTADKMEFEGRDLLTISSKDRRKIIGRDISMIFQEPMSSLNPCFNVGFQIGETLKQHLGLDRTARKKRSIELLELVGIPAPEERLKAFPHQLCGGMSQRVMIAIAISCNPKLLIADEPTTALDVTIQAQITDLLIGLQKEKGMALVLITHDMGVVAETAKRVIVMYAGQQVEQQAVEELFNTPRHPYTNALLNALPERSLDLDRLPTIEGVVPGAEDRPEGCLFSPRCGHSQDDCDLSVPPLESFGTSALRCFHPVTSAEPGK